MREIVRNIKYNMDIIKPSAKILLILLFILTFLSIFGSSIFGSSVYGSISRNSIILTVFLTISLFLTDEKNRNQMNALFLKNKNSVIYGRYAFVVLSYIILFAVLLFFSKTYLILMGKDTHLDNSLLFLSFSFLCFSVIVGFQITMCYIKGAQATLWLIVLIIFISTILFGFPKNIPFFADLTNFVVSNSGLTSFVFCIIGCIFLLISCNMSIKFCNFYKNN